VPGTSRIHRLWAGTKLVAVMAFGFGLAFSGQLWGFPAVAVLLLVGAAIARISPALLWRGLRPLLFALAVGILVLMVTSPGHAIAHIGPAVITRKGIENAIRFPGLLLLLALAAQIVNRTTPPAESVGALGVLLHPLRWLRVPVDELLTMVAISLRFLPILAEEVTRLRYAQATRGLSPGQGDLESRGQALQSWVVSLIHANLRRAADLGEAMDARGYGDPEQREFPVRRPHLGIADYAVLALSVGVSVAMVVVR
jgi:energy-coupling factor transport system permease protein